MWRRGRKTAILGALAGLLALLAPAPVRAGGQIGFASIGTGEVGFSNISVGCTEGAGVRFGDWVLSNLLDTPATLTAVTVKPDSVRLEWVTKIGTTVQGNASAAVQYYASSGETSASVSMTLHWDSRSDGGPLDQTFTDTEQLMPCLPDPKVTFTSTCQGVLQVKLANGTWHDGVTGGDVVFTLVAVGAPNPYTDSVRPGETLTVFFSYPNNSTVTVTDQGLTPPFVGHYVAKPGCVGYTAPPAASPTAAAGPPARGRTGPPTGAPTADPPTGTTATITPTATLPTATLPTTPLSSGQALESAPTPQVLTSGTVGPRRGVAWLWWLVAGAVAVLGGAVGLRIRARRRQAGGLGIPRPPTEGPR